jgi:hypothetical protein
LAIALSQQLQLEQDDTTTAKGMTGPTKLGNTTNQSNTSSSIAGNNLVGGDSIYSNYLRGISAIDSIDTSSSFQTSMFDSLLNKGSSNNTNHTSTSTTAAAAAAAVTATMTKSTTATTIATQVVLDSDISDSDEESKNSEESEDDDSLAGGRMTKGVRPIMERRGQDNRLLVQRKIDNWSSRVDPDANRVDANESMIARMKDRHRNQVKMAALRQQELMGIHMVPQYGAPQQSNNVVLPHPGMIMDPAQMFYQSPMHDMNMLNNNYPAAPITSPITSPSTSLPPVALPASFLPNPTHVALSAPYKKEGQEDPQPQPTEHQRPFVMSQSMSTPTINSRKSAMPQSQPPLPSALSNNSSFSSNHTHTSAKQQASAPSSVASLSSAALSQSTPETTKDNIIDSPIPIADTPTPTTEEDEANLADGIEADAESSDDEERKSVILRKKKSSKKLRQRSDDGDSVHQRQVRSSRSAPNLKKKQSKKASNSSKTSSRRTSQDFTATPPSEPINTPPPLPTQFHEEYVLPRSNSHHQLTHQQQQQMMMQQYRQSLRHMRSEPDLPRSGAGGGHRMHAGYQQQQQQQLNMEWERMQAYQREQQLKNQFQQPQQQQQQHMSFMPMYAHGYYPNTPNTTAVPGGMMPSYSGNNGMMMKPQDNRASHIMYGNNGSNVMMYPQQGYYQASSSR